MLGSKGLMNDLFCHGARKDLETGGFVNCASLIMNACIETGP